ncbi:HNH endonuclease [Paenibacillus oleatilyticus]|uniref:HNH endonuclease n=1 Tax=Paenibacillus oleatilyticus TaxID=2594886 RepID=UPI001C1F2B37|nr:HNH endonuclease [Paenibacillus oleatilyticus]MBU7316017.1 HNH endonuclease [Paenibacillus oleatilyticus]
MLIHTLDQLLKNIEKLMIYKDSDIPEEQSFFRETVERGKCYVVVKKGNDISFSPSRFIGYIDNDMYKHKLNDSKHGGYTNIEIDKILGKKYYTDEIENLFQTYCAINGLRVLKNKRTYWFVNLDDAEKSLIDDIKDIINLTPSKTDREILSLARIGQGKFRKDLINYWNGCAVTKCKTFDLLKASHIKPWRISSNEERLDLYNGLLLTPNLDALFDKGYISFDKLGKIVISTFLKKDDIKLFELKSSMSIEISSEHEKYLEYHRNNVFKN